MNLELLFSHGCKGKTTLQQARHRARDHPEQVSGTLLCLSFSCRKDCIWSSSSPHNYIAHTCNHLCVSSPQSAVDFDRRISPNVIKSAAESWWIGPGQPNLYIIYICYELKTQEQLSALVLCLFKLLCSTPCSTFLTSSPCMNWVGYIKNMREMTSKL